jgi:hypothetical protein
MALTALYTKYFQKSKIFLYPLLDIKRGNVVPTETYISWGTSYSPEDVKLICLYDCSHKDFVMFQNTVLLKHNRLCDYVKIDNKHTVFTFDFSDIKDDWHNFINGKYSRINENLKRKILNYFDKNSGNYVYVESYLFPKKYIKRYAELLDVSEELLHSVKELCDKPNLDKEKLLIEIADLENINESRLYL